MSCVLGREPACVLFALFGCGGCLSLRLLPPGDGVFLRELLHIIEYSEGGDILIVGSTPLLLFGAPRFVTVELFLLGFVYLLMWLLLLGIVLFYAVLVAEVGYYVGLPLFFNPEYKGGEVGFNSSFCCIFGF